MNPIYRDAIAMAGRVRRKLKFNQFQPINIFEACMNMGVDVQFVDINMEGFYSRIDGNAKMIISNKRPFPRRCYSAAHELGHHVFNHGLRVDILTEDAYPNTQKETEEILVDAFAAAFLMPVGGIQAEFAKRGWEFEQVSSVEFFIISSLFGVGYKTLLQHCRYSDLISIQKYNELVTQTPAKILKNLSSKIESIAHFKIIDDFCILETIDLEVSNYVILPRGTAVESHYLQNVDTCSYGDIYVLLNSGITTVHLVDSKKSIFLRIQKENYIGFAEYRYLEN